MTYELAQSMLFHILIEKKLSSNPELVSCTYFKITWECHVKIIHIMSLYAKSYYYWRSYLGAEKKLLVLLMMLLLLKIRGVIMRCRRFKCGSIHSIWFVWAILSGYFYCVIRVCLVELWFLKKLSWVMSCGKAVVDCGLWKNCKLFGSNKYKTYLPPISIFLKQLSIFIILKNRKAKVGSKVLLKLYYPRVAASSEAASSFHPFSWLLAFWNQK